VGKALEEGKVDMAAHSAWKPTKRSVIAWKVVRTALGWPSPFLCNRGKFLGGLGSEKETLGKV